MSALGVDPISLKECHIHESDSLVPLDRYRRIHPPYLDGVRPRRKKEVRLDGKGATRCIEYAPCGTTAGFSGPSS